MILGNRLLLLGMLFITQISLGQTAYKLYDKSGKEVDFNKMIKTLSKADVVLFGEQHNNPICHWLQLEVTEALYAKAGSLTLGAEMFEADNQLLIDEYFSDQIRTKDFEKEVRLWDNYKTDYKPLLEFAKSNNLKFVASNVPRRYAAIVNRKGLEGLDSLSDESKMYLPPLPIAYDTNNPSVNKMLNMDFGHGKGGKMAVSMSKAQSIKDATMANNIYTNREENIPFIHYQGDFHSANYGGIYWYLLLLDRKMDVITISSVEGEEGEEGLNFEEEYASQADFILIINPKMTKTY